MLTERTSYFFGVSGSMLLHLLIIAGALIIARPDLERRELMRPPEIIHARLVEMEARTPEPAAPQERVIDLTRRQPPPQAAPPPRITQPTPEPQQTAPAPPQPAPVTQPQPQTEAPSREMELPPVVQREQDFTTQLQAEAAAIADQADREQVMSYSAMIEQKVAANWSRPPSARRGMVVELRVNLVPTGRVNNVEVVRSSGDNAFDRSAIQAVQKADPFDQLQQLPSRVFEENFRNFRFRFSPDDLRL